MQEEEELVISSGWNADSIDDWRELWWKGLKVNKKHLLMICKYRCDVDFSI